MWLNSRIRFRDTDILWDALITRVSTKGNPSSGKPKDKTLGIKGLTGLQENEGAPNVSSQYNHSDL